MIHILYIIPNVSLCYKKSQRNLLERINTKNIYQARLAYAVRLAGQMNISRNPCNTT